MFLFSIGKSSNGQEKCLCIAFVITFVCSDFFGPAKLSSCLSENQTETEVQSDLARWPKESLQHWQSGTSMQTHPAVRVESESLLTEASQHCTVAGPGPGSATDEVDGRQSDVGCRSCSSSFTAAAGTASESIRVMVGARPVAKIMVT